MTWMFLFLSALTIAVDAFVWKKYLRTAPLGITLRSLLMLLIVLSDLLMPLSFAILRLIPDNTTAVVRSWGLVNLLFLCTVLPRMIVYAGYLGRRRIWRRLGWGIALGTIALFLWGALVCRNRLRVEEVTITSDRLPAAFDGVRIAFFSDLHIGVLERPETEIARLVDTIRSLRPDLILFGGDLINIRYTELDPAVSALLGRLDAPLGVYSVIGNHDTGVYIKDSLALDRETNLSRLIRRQEETGRRLHLVQRHLVRRRPAQLPTRHRPAGHRPRLRLRIGTPRILQPHPLPHPPALEPHYRRRLRRPDPRGPRPQHADEAATGPYAGCFARTTPLQAVERTLLPRRPGALHQRRHRCGRHSGTAGSGAGDHAHHPAPRGIAALPADVAGE